MWCVIAVLVIGNVVQLSQNLPRFNSLHEARTEAVPNEQTALMIVEAIYFEGKIDSLRELPYWRERDWNVTFDSRRRVWVVSDDTRGLLGVFPEITIRMRDARIMSIRYR